MGDISSQLGSYHDPNRPRLRHEKGSQLGDYIGIQIHSHNTYGIVQGIESQHSQVDFPIWELEFQVG